MGARIPPDTDPGKLCGKLCTVPQKSACVRLCLEEMPLAFSTKKVLIYKAVWVISTSVNGGAEEIRTPDPHVANVMLYQLSYRPESCRKKT